MGVVSLALQALPFLLRLQPFLPPPRLLWKLDALRLPLVHPPLCQRGVGVRGSQRASLALALVRSPLPPPTVRWERRGWGVARVLTSGGTSDSAASSLPGVGIVGSSRSQESLVLAVPSSVASSASAERGRRSRSRVVGGSNDDRSHSCSSRSSLPLGGETHGECHCARSRSGFIACPVSQVALSFHDPFVVSSLSPGLLTLHFCPRAVSAVLVVVFGQLPVSSSLLTLSSVTGLAPGCQEDVVQRCLGNRPRSGSRLLQLSFPGGKGAGGLASCDRPLSPERVCSAYSVQDGGSSLHASVCPRGRFPSFHRSEGCVFPDNRSSVVEEAIEIPVQGGQSVSSRPCASVCRLPLRSSLGCLQQYLHRIRLFNYLDDWLVLASSEAEAKRNVQDLLPHCHSLEIVMNKKSDLVPSQTANYLGMTIDTRAARIFLSLARVEIFLSIAETSCTLSALPAQLWQVVLGHLALLERLVPHNRL